MQASQPRCNERLPEMPVPSDHIDITGKAMTLHPDYLTCTICGYQGPREEFEFFYSHKYLHGVPDCRDEEACKARKMKCFRQKDTPR